MRVRLRHLRAGSLLALLAVYVGVGLLFAPGDRAIGDEPSFLRLAHALLHGRYALSSKPDATLFLWHGPGLPAALAPLVALHAPLWAVRLLGPALLWAAVLLFERLLRLWVSPRRALLGALALGLYAPLSLLVPSLHKEPLALLLLIGGLYGATVHGRTGRRRAAVLGGLALGGLVLTRLEFGWVLLLALLGTAAWACAQRQSAAPRRFATVIAVALAVCTPWLALTYAKTGRPLYWATSGGLSLYWMSTADRAELGDWHALHTVFRDPRLARHRPFFRRLERLGAPARDATLQRVATRNIAAHPVAYAKRLAANSTRLWLGLPYSFSGGLGPAWGLYATFGGALLALLGWLTATCARGRRRLARGAGPFALLGVGAVAVHLPVSADPRMLVPVVPLVIWAAVCSRPVSRTKPSPRTDGALAEPRLMVAPDPRRAEEAVR